MKKPPHKRGGFFVFVRPATQSFNRRIEGLGEPFFDGICNPAPAGFEIDVSAELIGQALQLVRGAPKITQ